MADAQPEDPPGLRALHALLGQLCVDASAAEVLTVLQSAPALLEGDVPAGVSRALSCAACNVARTHAAHAGVQGGALELLQQLLPTEQTAAVATAALLAHGQQDARVALHGCGVIARSDSTLDDARRAASAVTAAMRPHLRDEAVQVAGCEAMLALARVSVAELLAEGASKPVVAAMAAHAASRRLHLRACDALGALFCNQAPRKAPRAVGALMASAHAFSRDADVGAHALAALQHLCFSCPPNCAAAATSGAVAVAAAALAAHPEDEATQEHACCVLATLCHNDPALRMHAASGGAFRSIVAAMQRHTSSLVVQRHACRALANVCSNIPVLKVSAVQHGAIPALVAVMRAHADDLMLLCACLMALTNINLNLPAHSEQCGAAGAVDVMLAALRSPLAAQHEELRTAACKALCNVLCVDSARKLAADGGACELVVALLRAHPEQADMQVGACGTLGNIASAAHAARAGDAGAVEVCVAALRTHSREQLIVDHVTCALMSLLQHDVRNRERAAAAGLVPLAVAAQRSWPHDAELVGQALVCVQFIARVSPALAARAVREGAVSLAQRAPEALPGCADVDGAACNLLAALARHGGACAAAVAEAGALQRVVASIVAPAPGADDDVVDSRLQLLRELLVHGGAAAAEAAVRAGALPALQKLGVHCDVMMSPLHAAAAAAAAGAAAAALSGSAAAAAAGDVCALPGCSARTRADGSRKKLQQCAACRGVLYCSPEHQRKNWARHKRACRAAAAAREQAAVTAAAAQACVVL
jgi:hypothetical protein